MRLCIGNSRGCVEGQGNTEPVLILDCPQLLYRCVWRQLPGKRYAGQFGKVSNRACVRRYGCQIRQLSAGHRYPATVRVSCLTCVIKDALGLDIPTANLPGTNIFCVSSGAVQQAEGVLHSGGDPENIWVYSDNGTLWSTGNLVGEPSAAL
ncbi:hypothetical protein B0H17DRAFT_1173534 [Mycena rosella]|uniref:Uncharacterized protein n=1 Tax=Mycena rosella TaxID=1033263 RepID=A0AAD7MCF7_MYCRO|nr:hypothetical protein B0H17DRAFT_1173534 [Mycena rosella]